MCPSLSKVGYAYSNLCTLTTLVEDVKTKSIFTLTRSKHNPLHACKNSNFELKQVRLAQASSQWLDLISPLTQAGVSGEIKTPVASYWTAKSCSKINYDCTLCRQVHLIHWSCMVGTIAETVYSSAGITVAPSSWRSHEWAQRCGQFDCREFPWGKPLSVSLDDFFALFLCVHV